jgi:hypothetical protein
MTLVTTKSAFDLAPRPIRQEVSDLYAIARAQEAAVGSWGAERSFDKVKSLKPALLSAPLRSPDHIRLLLLYPPEQPERAKVCVPQDGHTEIRCKLFQGRLSELSCPGRPMYAALSYWWGSAAKSRTVLCNNTAVQITENLFHAMKWVRLPTRPRFIWIDCLCIDQKNIKEKSQQVSRMGSIFSQAHVISYIGGNTEPTHAQVCLAVVRRLAAIANYLMDRNCISNDQVRLPPLLYNINRPLNISDWQSVPWDKVVGLMNGNYFRRLWVVQEIQLARSHICQWGHHNCSIHQLNKAARIISLGQDETIASTTLSGCGVDYIENHNVQVMARDPWMFDQETEHGLPDLKLVTNCSRFGCKDPRDRIYGLVSLFKGNGAHHVNYASSVAEVFSKFALRLLSMKVPGYRIPILAGHHAHRSAYRDPNRYAQEAGWTWSSDSLPSWCPDYGLGGQEGINHLGSPFDRPSYQLGPNSLLAPKIRPVSWSLLSARAIECATIGACSNQRRSDQSLTEFLLKAGQLALRLQDNISPDEICAGFLDALRNGIPFRTHEYAKHTYNSSPRLYRYDAVLTWLGQYYLEKHVPFMLPLCGDSARNVPCFTKDQIKAFVEEMESHVRWESEIPRPCFTTADSPAGARFGCGPDVLRVGDKVFVICGIPRPVILRQIGRERRFKYIRNSQIYGLMEGEVSTLGLKEEEVLLV